MKQSKVAYLTPKVKVVLFMVEGGFGPSEWVKTPKPAAGSNGALYTEIDNSDGGAFKNDFQYINQ